ncbi:hypothetical protein ACN28E_34565 [Archangium lansingense]
MRTAKTMLVQYQSIAGKQVLRYSLDGFRSKLDELCSKYPKECGPFPDVAANQCSEGRRSRSRATRVRPGRKRVIWQNPDC